jgi:2-succinyl-6-hydroxy-2,4-cyclohexadiene-1-carboxylate synthase
MLKLQSQYWPGGSLPIHYYHCGRPSQPRLVFFHGFMGSGYDWKEMITYFSRQYYCIAPDLPGHGKTVVDPPDLIPDWKSLALTISHFIKAQSEQPVIGTGYSMGGRLALYLAVTFPAIFKALILESASPGLKTAGERRARLQHDRALAAKMEKSDFNNFLQDWYHQPLFLSLTEHDGFDRLLKMRGKQNPVQLAAALRLMSSGRQPSLWKQLDEIDIPLLLMTGEADLKYSRLLSQMKKLCRHGVLHIVPQTGHNIHFENPLVFLEYMSNFLNQIGENP